MVELQGVALPGLLLPGVELDEVEVAAVELLGIEMEGAAGLLPGRPRSLLRERSLTASADVEPAIR